MSHVTVNTYKTLHTLAQYLAIFPKMDPLSYEVNSSRICIVINVAVLVFVQAHVAHVRYETFHGQMVATAYYGRVLSDILILGTNIWNIINAHRARKTVAKMLRSFDALSHTTEGATSPKLQQISERFIRSYKVEVIGTHVACIFCFAVIFYEWNRFFGYKVAINDMLNHALYYPVVVFAMVVRHFVCLIRHKVILLKYMLWNILPPTQHAEYVNCNQHLEFTLSQVQDVFGTVNDIIASFNEIYGCSIVACYVNVFVTIIVPINMMMLYGNGNRELLGERFDFFFSFVLFALMLYPVVLGLAILSIGQQTIDEIKEIPKICYALGQKVDIMTKLQLHEFALHVVNLNPQFTACGYFILNYSVITSIFSAIVSYVIVLVQFNNFY